MRFVGFLSCIFAAASLAVVSNAVILRGQSGVLDASTGGLESTGAAESDAQGSSKSIQVTRVIPGRRFYAGDHAANGRKFSVKVYERTRRGMKLIRTESRMAGLKVSNFFRENRSKGSSKSFTSTCKVYFGEITKGVSSTSSGGKSPYMGKTYRSYSIEVKRSTKYEAQCWLQQNTSGSLVLYYGSKSKTICGTDSPSGYEVKLGRYSATQVDRNGKETCEIKKASKPSKL